MTKQLRSGIDPSHIDKTFRPQDDLYRYFNGRWLKDHEIPQDRSSDGITYQLYLEAEAQVREIIDCNRCRGRPKDPRSI